jgi:hypothetical protein
MKDDLNQVFLFRVIYNLPHPLYPPSPYQRRGGNKKIRERGRSPLSIGFSLFVRIDSAASAGNDKGKQ